MDNTPSQKGSVYQIHMQTNNYLYLYMGGISFVRFVYFAKKRKFACILQIYCKICLMCEGMNVRCINSIKEVELSVTIQKEKF